MSAQDAYLKEVYLLQHLASGLQSCSNAIELRCNSIRTEAHSKQEKLQLLLFQVRGAVERAVEKLAYAKEQFEYYRYNTDEEDYCTSEAYALREAVEEAMDELDTCREEYNRVQLLCGQVEFLLEQLESYTQSFQPSLESSTSTLCHSLQQAAHEIAQYKSIQ